MARYRGYGTSPPGKGARWSARFPEQPVSFHEIGYEPTQEDRAAVDQGKRVFLTGRVLALVEMVCALMGTIEVIYYFLVRKPGVVIEELYVPEQWCSPCFCEVPAETVIRSGREIRRRGFAVFSAGHSHGASAVFTSQTDRNQERTLLLESVARVASITEPVEGNITESVGRDGEGVLRAAAVDGSIAVEIASRRGPLRAKDVSVRLYRSWQRSLSSFATSNSSGEHMVPGLSVTTCPVCRHREEREIPASEVEVHVIGPMELSEEEKEAVAAEVDEKVSVVWGYAASGQVYVNRIAGGAGTGASVQIAAPDPFVVSRHGQKVATVDASVLEKAAALNPELNRALGWDREERDGNGKQITCDQKEKDGELA